MLIEVQIRALKIVNKEHNLKSIHNLAINGALVKDGKIQNWSDFKKEVDKLNIQYNINYLNTEYKTALQSANMAKNWKEYQSNKKLYPNLKYRTQGDNKVRD